MKNKNISRVYLLSLFVVFFAPLFFAMWLYYGSSNSFVTKTQNYGELIQPPRPLGKFTLANNESNIWTHDQIEGKWTLLYLGDEICNLYCEASLFKMSQVRLSLGRDSQRVQRIYIAMTQHADTVIKNLVFNKYPDMQITFLKRSYFYMQLPQFKDMSAHKIYLIDPLGNLMMSYSKDATAKGMHKDLKRLLKVSKIG